MKSKLHLDLAGWGVIQSEAICYARWEERVILKGLLTLLTQRPEFRRLVQQIQEAEGLPALTGITETSRPFVVAALSAALKEPLLLVVADEEQAQQVVDTLKAMAASPGDIVFMPDRDALPYERLISDHETTQQRMNALMCMIDGEQPNLIVVCSARALSQPVIPPKELAASLYDLEPGQEVDLTLMLEHLYNLGYEPVTEVEEPGQFSHRGGIVDLFPPRCRARCASNFSATKSSRCAPSIHRRSARSTPSHRA